MSGDFCFHEDHARNEAGSDGKRGHRYSRYLCCVHEVFQQVLFWRNTSFLFGRGTLMKILCCRIRGRSAHMEIIRKIEKYNSYVIAVWHMIRSEIFTHRA